MDDEEDSGSAAIASYLKQLTYGEEGDKVQAAKALGNLASFLPARHRSKTLKSAVEMRVWSTLHGALSAGMESTDIEDAIVVALAQLLTPPAAAAELERESGKDQTVARRCLEQLMQDFTLGQFNAVRTLLACMHARLVCCIHSTYPSLQSG